MTASPALAADGNVTGTVFRDFNANGVIDAGHASGSGIANDEGFGGVTVTAYDADGGPSWTTVSAADGTYSIPVAGASGNTVRVEFSGLPAGYQPGAVHSKTGVSNGTAVQFAALGSDSVDFAVNAPEDYSQNNAPLATAVQWAGSPSASEGGTMGAQPALAAMKYDNHFTGGQPAGFPGRVNLATFGEVGSISSEVYQQSSNSIFVAAALKRQSGLGSLGLGGIYRVTDVLGADGDVSDAGDVEPWLDVTSIGVDVGTVASNVARDIQGHQHLTNDQPGFAEAAKVGIGDMVLSIDGKTLFFINLSDKKLYSLDVSNPDVAPTTYTSFDLGLGEGERPWGLTIFRGSIYVGYVETGEATGDVAQPGTSAAAAELQFHVISAPVTTLSGWTDVLTGDLGYTKGDVYQNTLAPQSHQWNTWADTWTWTGGSVGQANGGWQIYPQAILSDLHFDEDGYLSLGFIDRTSIQGGNRSSASDPAVTGLFETGASGDMLIAAPVGDGTFALEENGVVGNRTTLNGRAEGPGGREFYNDSLNLGAPGNLNPTHREVTLGYLAGLIGSREVVSTSYDPLAGIRLAGLMWFDIDNGDPVAGYELNADGGATGEGGNFQKGGGLGGISLLADAAPVEVGNRVWFDADKDGIQGPEEPPIGGLTVQLLKDGVVIGTTTTDANGDYYFSSDPTSTDFFVEGFTPNSGDYDIQFVKPTSGDLTIPGSTMPWNKVRFTTQESTSTETGSNPDPTTGRATFTVGGPGMNNHSIDAGFAVDEPSVDIEKGDNGAAGTDSVIVNDADTMADGESYAPGETRTVVFTVTNDGTEPLRNVVLTDETLAGAGVKSLSWAFPDGSTTPATLQDGVLTAQWDATFGQTPKTWLPGQIITGTATLTLGAGGAPHVDSATVTAIGAGSGIPVEDEDKYNAFVPAIQVIKYDGERPDPTVTENGNWITPVKPLTNAAQDANTSDEAVVYPVNTPQSVRWVATNTGSTSLTNITLADVTNDGPAVGADWTADLSPFGGPATYSFVNDGPWAGILPPGASFFAEGTLALDAQQTHSDTVTVVGTVVVPEVDANGVPTGKPSLDVNGKPIVALDDNDQPITLTDDDPFHARTGVGPFVDIEKGDNGGTGTSIVNDADTMADAESYSVGETRTVVFTVINAGDEALREVTLTDETLAGAGVKSLSWTFPDGSTTSATDQNGVLTAKWDATFGAGTATWLPNTVIKGTATLTLGAGGVPHVDSATVTAVGAGSGIPVEDEDKYNAFVPAIQVIKYDGERPDPIVNENGTWITPVKPLADTDQDANTTDKSVVYPVNTPQSVRWVVTNTGSTSLTNITLVDVTNNGPAVGADWTADLSPFGGPAEYSFVEDGPWAGILPPGASFFAEGTLSLAAQQTHSDTVTVVGTVVVPEVDENDKPTGNPSLDENGDPIVALNENDEPITLTDNDPFHARTGVGPFVDIEKGDGTGTTITNDADTMATGQVYTSGETREIVFVAENTGDEPLRNVVLTEDALSGAEVVALEWTFPDGTTAKAEEVDGLLTANWKASFAPGTATWLPGEQITGHATLTIAADQPAHVDLATVNAVGTQSEIPVEDEDPYNAYTGAIQVIKYDGNRPDPKVTDGTNWIIPAKPLVTPSQDANTDALAVEVKSGVKNTVRWVVTNTGTTTLTHLELTDVTNSGVAISGDWTADLSAFGGPAAYSFVKSGPWDGMLPPGASFFAEGKLTLGVGEQHADTVTVVGQVVVPEVDVNGLPTGKPSVDDDGKPVVAQRDGKPFSVTDNDPFHAKVPSVLASTGVAGGVTLFSLMLLLIGGGLLLRTRWLPLMARRKS
ncbi:MAG: SdrD B-like domain-containing protein [Rhodoglobus sp.]